ncbi:MAG TPA: ATP-dependent zinc metalloprotease FtsH [Anaerolineaceae bacterium]|nr:ATP-dependent zinc metalloprotease FtsH [Anaerolineaceae bacterium]
MKPRRQSFIISALLLLAIVTMTFYGLRQQTIVSEMVPINRVASELNEGKITKLEADGDTLYIKYEDPKQTYKSTLDPKMGLIDQLTLLGVTETALQNPNLEIRIKVPGFWTNLIIGVMNFLPFILMGVLFWVFIRQAQGSNNAAMQFGKSRARMLSGEQSTVTFADVAGVDEAKEELQEVVEFLKEPQKFMALGARIPKGVLLIGSPGTGKTLMAKAVSGEAGVPFFSISGSEFVEMFVGVGASRVRDLFDEAKKRSPCIVFVDEIDAVGRQRGAGLGGSHDEREQTLNQLLVEMDGFGTDTNVIVIAATNRPDILDPALLRPGRFDRRVMLDKPDMKGREEILKVHARGKPISNEVDLGVLARGTPGFAGADLENLVNEAALLAARRNKKVIGNSEFEEAVERVIAGPERKSRLMNEDEKRLTAYHEAGHAIVIASLPEGDPIQKISIISRGMMGGFTLSLPVEDINYQSKKMILADITGLLGGRAAEELMANDITTGASNDIERVTKLARAMVTRLGMSEEMGPMVYGQKEELVFLGREISEQRDYSEAVAEKIDAEVSRIVKECYQHAKDILTEHKGKLIELAEKLLDQETISKEEFEEIFPSPTKKTYGVPLIITD